MGGIIHYREDGTMYVQPWVEVIDATADKDREYRETAPPDVAPILRQYHSWAVTEHGVESLDRRHPYPIDKDRVHSPTWAIHMAAKDWVRMYDFLRALDHAQRLWPNDQPPAPPLIVERVVQRFVTRRPPDSVSGRLRFDVLRRDDYTCQLCGRTAQHGVALHVDHQIPTAKGGTCAIENLWTLCADCNLAKSDTLA